MIILLLYLYLLLYLFSSAFIPFMERNSVYYDCSDQIHLFSFVLPLMHNIQIHIDVHICLSLYTILINLVFHFHNSEHFIVPQNSLYHPLFD